MPDPDPRSRDALLTELADAVRANQRATDELDGVAAQLLGINRTDATFLDLLDQHGRMSAGELSRETRLTTGAVTAAIDRLQRAGYVQRVDDPGDRRRVLVEPTERTRQLTLELFGPLGDAAGELLAHYSEDELELLIEFQKLGRKMQEEQASVLRERLSQSR